MLLGTFFAWLTRRRRIERIREQTARLHRDVEQLEAFAIPFRRMGETYEAWQLRLLRAALNRDELDAKRGELEILLDLALQLEEMRWPWSRPSARTSPRTAARSPARRELSRHADARAEEPGTNVGQTGQADLVDAGQPRREPAAAERVAGATPMEPPADRPAPDLGVTMVWLGGACFRLTSPRGKVVLTNPWDAEKTVPWAPGEPPRADIVLASGGGAAESEQVARLARATGAHVVHLALGQGLWPEAAFPEGTLRRRVGHGDLVALGGIDVYVIGTPRDVEPGAAHASPSGFVIVFENGWVVYFAVDLGDSGAQTAIARAYRPDFAILPLALGADPGALAAHVQTLASGSPHLVSVFVHPGTADREVEEGAVAATQAATDAMGIDIAITAPGLHRVYVLRQPETAMPRQVRTPRAGSPRRELNSGASIPPAAPSLEPAPAGSDVLSRTVDVSLPAPLDLAPCQTDISHVAIPRERPEALDFPIRIAVGPAGAEWARVGTAAAVSEGSRALVGAGVAAEARGRVGDMQPEAATDDAPPPPFNVEVEAESIIAIPLVLSTVMDERHVIRRLETRPLAEAGTDTRPVGIAAAIAEASLIPMEANAPPVRAGQSFTPSAGVSPPTERPVAEVKPPPFDVAGVLPFVQKRRQREYGQLRHEIILLEAEVARLGRLYDAWRQEQGHPDEGVTALSTRRLREAAASEDLRAKRQQLDQLKARVASMEARYPALTRE